MATKKTTGKFVTEVLKSLNKSDAQVQQEGVETFVQDATIEAQSQLSMLQTSELAKAKLDLTRAENEVTKKQTAYDTVRFSTAHSFEQYVKNRESALNAITTAENAVSSAKSKIAGIESQISFYEGILSDLES